MDRLFYALSAVGFLVAPPAVLWVRYRVGTVLPWCIIVPVIAGSSWLFSNSAVHFFGQYVCSLVGDPQFASEQALARCTDDGARHALTWLFGWTYGLMYSIPFIVVFGELARRRNKSLSNASSA